MYQLFKDVQMQRQTKIDSPRFIFVRNMLLKEMTRIRNYNRESNIVVNGEHIVNQLLLNLNVALSRDLESYVRVCSVETERLARTFRLVHPVVDNPKPLSGHFYNADTKEFIILHANAFDYNRAYEDWTRISPIKIHYHSYTDMSMGIPNGNYSSPNGESGYAVISINLPMLAVQYKAWVDKVNDLREFKTQTVNFIHQYPVTNMLYRHMDIVLINRMMAIYRDKPVAPFKSVHAIAVSNLSSAVDEVLNTRINIIKAGQYKFDQLFNIFGCLVSPTWFNLIRPIDLVPVRSVKWVLELQVIAFFEFFLEVRRASGGNYNNMELTRALRDIRNLDNDAMYYKSHFPDIDRRLKNLKTLLSTL